MIHFHVLLFSDGKNKALIIEMCLKPSNYATMVLREILKNDTSAETQAALSASYDTENAQSNLNEDNYQDLKESAKRAYHSDDEGVGQTSRRSSFYSDY